MSIIDQFQKKNIGQTYTSKESQKEILKEAKSNYRKEQAKEGIRKIGNFAANKISSSISGTYKPSKSKPKKLGKLGGSIKW